MFDNIKKVLKKIMKKNEQHDHNSKDAAKERLHLVLMQDRANVSADFLELMKQEIIDVIKKYIDVDESAIDVRLTNKDNGDGTKGAPALYANIPIVNIKDETRKKSQTNVMTNNKEMINEISENANELKDVNFETKSASFNADNNIEENKVVTIKENTMENQDAEEKEILHEAEEYIKTENNDNNKNT